MKDNTRKYLLLFGLAIAVWAWNGQFIPNSSGDLISSAEAIVGAPATPVSYAGVARRSTVGVGAPGVGAAPMNLGGPVNRVGRR